jgi:hypothetical protein
LIEEPKSSEPPEVTLAPELLGLWVGWHLYGGFVGLMSASGRSRATMYRRLARFRAATGMHPAEFDMPGARLDRFRYRAAVRQGWTIADGAQQQRLW